MTVAVAGSIRFPPENLERLRPHILQMMAASRQEDGNIEYGFAIDVGDPGAARIFEVWRDSDALAAHGKAPHIAPWRAACADCGVYDRKLTVYEIAGQRSL